MWNLQNQYNSPTEQITRLKVAGLNPNLVYGSGVTGNNAGTIPKYSAPHLEKPNLDFSLAPTISAYSQVKMNEVQYDNLQKVNEGVTLDNARKSLENAGMAIDIANKQWLNDQYPDKFVNGENVGKSENNYTRIAMKDEQLSKISEFRVKRETADEIINQAMEATKQAQQNTDILGIKFQQEKENLDILKAGSKLREYGFNPNGNPAVNALILMLDKMGILSKAEMYLKGRK